MDLEVQDVAQLLGVPEQSIADLLHAQKIPSYKIDGQVRFDRMEIEKWMVNANLVPLSDATQAGTQQFSLYRALHKGLVVRDLECYDKEDLIHKTMNEVCPSIGLDPDVLSEMLLDREKLMSTGLSKGIAVPHPRDLVLKGLFDRIIVVFPSQPLEWGSLDGEKVHTLFFLFSSTDKRHLHLLSKIAHLTSSEKAMAFLKKKPSKEALLDFVRDWEMNIKTP